MKYDKQACIDVILVGTKHEQMFRTLSDRINERAATKHAGISRVESETRARLEGDEGKLLTGIAGEYIHGEIMSVDGILSDGINVSANITFDELHRIHMSPMRFRVKTEIKI